MSKADYVRSQVQTRPHTCHWPNCNKQVKPALWGCSTHWFKLPAVIRQKIWAAYQPGQEAGLKPVSKEYLKIAREAENWIKNYEKCQEEQTVKIKSLF